MKFHILLISFFSISSLFAQRYTDAIGLRFANLGFTQINGKHFTSENTAIEANIGGNSNYVWLQGNFELQYHLTKEVDYYLGAGPGLGLVSGNPILGNSSTSRFMLGANAVAGVEYMLPDHPFTFSLETGPYLQVIPNVRLAWNFGIAARYVLR
jgi:hypothetical protein